MPGVEMSRVVVADAARAEQAYGEFLDAPLKP